MAVDVTHVGGGGLSDDDRRRLSAAERKPGQVTPWQVGEFHAMRARAATLADRDLVGKVLAGVRESRGKR